MLSLAGRGGLCATPPDWLQSVDHSETAATIDQNGLCHDALLREAIEAHAGRFILTTGDGCHAVFAAALTAGVAGGPEEPGAL